MAGRTSFTKRQKEQARQQKQRDKADRKNQRKLEDKQPNELDDASELQRLAQEQAALFRVGLDDSDDNHSSDDGPDKDRH